MFKKRDLVKVRGIPNIEWCVDRTIEEIHNGYDENEHRIYYLLYNEALNYKLQVPENSVYE